ncbi:MAG TPA: hypothetical protein VFZ65_04585 [Planctomycetota bacterium]|nr:hypothetical protein [Planctomycetota bacterium]
MPRQPLRLRCRPAHLADAEAWAGFYRAHPVDWRDALVDLGEVDLLETPAVRELVVAAAAGY